MIVDNKYCTSHAERIVRACRDKGNDQLVREISGELMRFFTLGKFHVLAPLEAALDAAKKREP